MMGGGVAATAAATISYESYATASNTSTADLVINKPTGTAEGDLLVVTIIQDTSDTTTVTLPDGWTLIHDIASSSSRTTVAYKTAGASEGASYTFTNTDTYKAGVISRFSKSGGTWDIEAASETAISASTTITSASVTATNDSMLLFCWGSDDNVTVSTAPANMTQIHVAAPGSAMAGMWYEARSAGDVTKSLIVSANHDGAAIAVILDLVP